MKWKWIAEISDPFLSMIPVALFISFIYLIVILVIRGG